MYLSLAKALSCPTITKTALNMGKITGLGDRQLSVTIVWLQRAINHSRKS